MRDAQPHGLRRGAIDAILVHRFSFVRRHAVAPFAYRRMLSILLAGRRALDRLRERKHVAISFAPTRNRCAHASKRPHAAQARRRRIVTAKATNSASPSIAKAPAFKSLARGAKDRPGNAQPNQRWHAPGARRDGMSTTK